jgi:hypothetical protein
MLPDLLTQIPLDQELGSVTADGAYDTRKCHDAIAARNAYPVIPPRKNAKLWKPDTQGARARNEAVRSSKYLGRALWRQVTGYHRRSRVETKMHSVFDEPCDALYNYFCNYYCNYIRRHLGSELLCINNLRRSFITINLDTRLFMVKELEEFKSPSRHHLSIKTFQYQSALNAHRVCWWYGAFGVTSILGQPSWFAASGQPCASSAMPE